MLPIALGVCLLAVPLAIVLLRSRPKVEPPGRANTPRGNSFAAVELIPGSNGCSRAREMSLEPMLAADAPALPLEGCKEQCRCRFRKHDGDRRQINRRRKDDGLCENFIYAGGENRSNDRRDS